MRTNRMLLLFVFLACGVVLSCSTVSSSPEVDDPTAVQAPDEEITPDPAKLQTAVFAGGCFWGVEAVFEHVKGVASARSGYAGGDAKSATYDEVSSGSTGHAEAVEVSFDPERVSYEQLLDVFFKVAHSPTELDRQGPDVGPQYRSAIFYSNEEQKRSVEEYIKKLDAAKIYSEPVVTQIVPLEKFYEAEAYHQDYLPRNLKSPYIVYHDLPKLENLKKQFPVLFVDRLRNSKTARK